MTANIEALVRRHIEGLEGAERTAWETWMNGENAEAFLGLMLEAELPSEVRNGALHINLFGPLGGLFGVDASQLNRTLKGQDAKPVVLHIDSPGGRYQTGSVMRQRLLERTGSTDAVIEGLCASAATMVAAGCKKRRITMGGQWMIHETRASLIGVRSGQLDGIKRSLEEFNDEMASMYATLGKGDKKHYRRMMAKETFYSARETAEEGFAVYADKILAENTTSGVDNTSGGAYFPPKSSISNGGNDAMTPEEQAQMDALRSQVATLTADAEQAKAQAAQEAQVAAKAEADAAIAAAKATAKAAEDAQKLAEAKLADVQLDAQVAKYPEGQRPLAKLAIQSGDAAAIAGLDSLMGDAETSGTMNSDPQAADDPEKPDSPWDRLAELAAKAQIDNGMTAKQARAFVASTAEGKALHAKMSEARQNLKDKGISPYATTREG